MTESVQELISRMTEAKADLNGTVKMLETARKNAEEKVTGDF